MDTVFLDSAVKTLRTSGGLVTVVLGKGFDAPTDWSLHPQVHWVLSSTVKRHEVSQAIPPNTRLMFIAGNVAREVFQPLHDERKKRRVPYLVKKTPEAVADALRGIFPAKAHVVPDAPTAAIEPPFDTTPESGNGHKTHAKRGSVQDFIKEHGDLRASTNVAEEARRLMPIAQRLNITTTFGSLQQGLRVLKRRGGFGSRPESATSEPINDVNAVALALETAIATLTTIKARVERMDEANAALRKDNEDLKARIVLMRDAFKDL